jgi:hypothetical protein
MAMAVSYFICPCWEENAETLKYDTSSGKTHKAYFPIAQISDLQILCLSQLHHVNGVPNKKV